jgi:hypothetical protein
MEFSLEQRGDVLIVRVKELAVKLSGLQRRVDTMLSMTGVHRIVDVCRDEAEALAAFA